MPQTCSVCKHPQRGEIDAALVAGRSLRDIACQFKVGRMALQRHKADHIPAALAHAQGAAEVAHGDDLLLQVKSLQAKSLDILKKAEDAGDLRTAVSAIAQARGNLELIGKLAGELQQQPTVNILLMPEWVGLRSAILAALDPFPDAGEAVTRAISR